MSGYILHPEAFNDLDEIRAYIAEGNPDAADRVVAEIFQKIRGLVEFPHQGYRRPNLSSLPLRFAVVREYLIAYAPDKAPLRVLRGIPRTPQSARNGRYPEGQGMSRYLIRVA